MYKIKDSNSLILDLMVLIEKQKLIRKCQNDLVLKEIVSFLHGFKNKEIVIFGSITENPKKADDVDILITGNISKDRIKDFEKKFELKFHMVDLDTLEQVTKSLKEEIIKKHLIIQGSENIVKWMLEN
jgi:predicted nucleotidyltransferase